MNREAVGHTLTESALKDGTLRFGHGIPLIGPRPSPEVGDLQTTIMEGEVLPIVVESYRASLRGSLLGAVRWFIPYSFLSLHPLLLADGARNSPRKTWR